MGETYFTSSPPLLLLGVPSLNISSLSRNINSFGALEEEDAQFCGMQYNRMDRNIGFTRGINREGKCITNQSSLLYKLIR